MTLSFNPNSEVTAEYLSRFEKSAGDLLNFLRNSSPASLNLNARIQEQFINNLRNVHISQLNPQVLNKLEEIQLSIEARDLKKEFQGSIEAIKSLVRNFEIIPRNVNDSNAEEDIAKVQELKMNPNLLKNFKIQNESKDFINMLFDGLDFDADKLLFSFLSIVNIMEAFKRDLFDSYILTLYSPMHLRGQILEDLTPQQLSNLFPSSLPSENNKARFAFIEVNEIIRAFDKDLFTHLNMRDLISISQLNRFIMKKHRAAQKMKVMPKHPQEFSKSQSAAENTSSEPKKNSEAPKPTKQNSEPVNLANEEPVYSTEHKKNCDILGVPYNATKDVIRQAYKKLILKFHPDRNKEADAAEKFNIIHEAYKALVD